LQRLFVLAEVERRHDQLPGKIKRSMTRISAHRNPSL